MHYFIIFFVETKFIKDKSRVLNFIKRNRRERVFSSKKNGYVDIKKEEIKIFNLNEKKK